MCSIGAMHQSKHSARLRCESVQSERRVNGPSREKSQTEVTGHLGTHRASLMHLSLKGRLHVDGSVMKEVQLKRSLCVFLCVCVSAVHF